MTRFSGWECVAERLFKFAEEDGYDLGNVNFLNPGQRLSLEVIARRLPKHGIILADEVSEVQIISQNFANWQNRANGNDELAPQNLLLPALYAIYHSKFRSPHHPNSESHWPSNWHRYTLRAATSIARSIGKRELRKIAESGNFRNWKKQSSYEKHSDTRRTLHQAIGRGLALEICQFC